MPHLFPSLGPALMVSMGYIDLGKWVAAVEGGARFGFDLVSLVLFFNCTAILCQYLATCIGMVTGKNLAEVFSNILISPQPNIYLLVIIGLTDEQPHIRCNFPNKHVHLQIKYTWTSFFLWYY